MKTKSVEYSYCYTENNNNGTTGYILTKSIDKLPKINMKLPKISLELCENLNLLLG